MSRNVNCDTLPISLLFIEMLISGGVHFLLNSMNFDLSVFKDSLLSCSQVFTFFNSLLIYASLDCKGKSSILKYRVVSSAYIKKLNLLVELTISLIHILKNNGPKIDSWGIPVFTSNRSDSQSL